MNSFAIVAGVALASSTNTAGGAAAGGAAALLMANLDGTST